MLQKLKLKYYRFMAIRRLIKRYEYENEVNRILEEWDTYKLLQGGNEKFVKAGRDQLAEMQARIKETQAMVDFVKTLR